MRLLAVLLVISWETEWLAHISNALSQTTYSDETGWARLGAGTWARGVQAHTLGQTRVGRTCATPRPGGEHAAGARRPFNGCRLRWWLGEDGHSTRPDKHAGAHGAFEVALALDAAIVFTGAIVELDTDPIAHGETGLADEADEADAAIAELDLLPEC
jgi:hypothetical protein